jgi:hypothetical protein
MPKNPARPEIYLMLHLGLKPKQIIAKGFKSATVYRMSAKYKRQVLPDFNKAMGI